MLAQQPPLHVELTQRRGFVRRHQQAVADRVAVEAVACAVEAQRSLALRNEALPTGQRLELRIGIHVGDVIAEGDRIAGDAVNVAARIEALAPHGGVALSGATHEQVVGKLDIAFEDLGERVLEQTRLLTLTGIGGARKSRLSLELARRGLANPRWRAPRRAGQTERARTGRSGRLPGAGRAGARRLRRAGGRARCAALAARDRGPAGDRLKLLASRERSGEKRHATLRATLDWSHELLEESERALLRRLSVFCDPFTLDAAE